MKTILLIEDNDEMRENTAEILELGNYHVITAWDGKMGIELATLSGPDLIISDITMPKMDGFDVIRSLRKSVLFQRTPVIFLTARSEKEYISKAQELGVNVYLTKPYDGTELLNAVKNIINQKPSL